MTWQSERCASKTSSKSRIVAKTCVIVTIKNRLSSVAEAELCLLRQILVRCVIFLRIAFTGSRLITGDPSCQEALLTAKQPVSQSQMFAQRFPKSCLGLKHKVAGIDCLKKRIGSVIITVSTAVQEYKPLWIITIFLQATLCVLNHLLNVWNVLLWLQLHVFLILLVRETNLKFKMGLRVTDQRLQEERQLAAYDGACCALVQITSICDWILK